jgi:hypothetical protein
MLAVHEVHEDYRCTPMREHDAVCRCYTVVHRGNNGFCECGMARMIPQDGDAFD